ncbi:hypothetical protein N2597_22565 (plasmid) [Rhizobium sophoriradicis]|uniref:hypothetical protein n=1 Tax=Rhizobium sophoriradicis TaxID=1535245 RepID=UPI0016230A8C|nr:hypothetical protein N2597_22565 [Rhizobium leguminosarum bv. phaseoli]
MFHPPANQDDLAESPDLKNVFLELWNRQSPDLEIEVNYMGDFVTIAAGNPNFVDPRQSPTIGDPASVPWNGFPRLLSRYYQDTTSEAARARAEEVAEILTPVVYWFVQRNGRTSLRSALAYQLPLHATNDLGLDELIQIARPLRELLPSGDVGDEILQSRRQQDEYLEWHVDRNSDGTIRRIIFTAEPPDYWRALAKIAPDRVVELYREHVDQHIQKSDLFYPEHVAVFGRFADSSHGWLEVPTFGGQYNPLNPWTTTKGVMHLTHAANTLGAEVNLAGEASVLRSVDSLPVKPGQDPAPEIVRIACGAYGGINRSSDPNIGLAVGNQVRKGDRITLTDPVGLYIAKIDLNGLSGPDGEALGSISGSVTRGHNDPFEPRILRYVVQLPEGSRFTLSDCRYDNRPLVRGAQIARETTVQLYVNVYPGSAVGGAKECVGRPCRHPDNGQIFDIGDNRGNCAPVGDPSWLTATPYEGANKDVLAKKVSSGWKEPQQRVLTTEKVSVPPERGYNWNKRGY